MIDIVIPLGNGSKSGNDELRLLLRSIEKYGRGYRRIIVVSDCAPAWLRGVTILPSPDPLPRNKDGNIIKKILKAVTETEITSDFVWTCDDCVILKDLPFAFLPPIYNNRNPCAFPENGTIWQRRVRRTFDFLATRGIHLSWNFESHTPQRFPVQELIRAMMNVDYCSDIGFSVNTLFYGVLGITEGFDQRLFKETCENASCVWRLNKMLIGYNDEAFLNGLREKLFELFPEKSKYEEQ